MASVPLEVVQTWRFDSADFKPLYQQLYDHLRKAILAGVLPCGLRLPGTRSLARQVGLARNTVLAAYEQLQAEGFLQSKAGSGFEVCEGLGEGLPLKLASAFEGVASQPELSQLGQRITTAISRAANHLRLPLQPGEPDCSMFPSERWLTLASREMRRIKRADLTYGEALGDLRLRTALSVYLGASRGVVAPAERILITSGAQQALDLCFRLLLDAGDDAALEEPGYTGCRGALQVVGANLQALQSDREGACIPVGKGSAPRVVYLTPSHQYPLGMTMSLERRLAWLQYAAQQGIWLLEDDYDSEFRYDSKPLAAIQGLSPQSQRQVLYMGTFSKVMFPSLRLGYLVIPQSLVAAFVKLRSFCDTQPPILPQRTMAAFMEDGKFASHIRSMRQVYAARRRMTLAFAEEHLKDRFNWQDTPAGMHLTLIARTQDWDDVAAANAMRERGVGARALSDYCFQRRQRGLVVGYAGYGEQSLQAALQVLAEVCQQ